MCLRIEILVKLRQYFTPGKVAYVSSLLLHSAHECGPAH
jgi:hypothetical protein